MRIIRTVAELRAALRPDRAAARVGFVPTMGALHEGHVALFAAARADCDRVVASVFVNPRQFDDPADLDNYPRPEARDAAIAEAAGVDVVFIPPVSEVYPANHATVVVAKGAAVGFEGARRPGHFDGVATVCLSLFHMVEPDAAYFGQKDAQQVAVIRQLVRDTHLPFEVRVVPTVREPDGLALSSRNTRLSAADRARAAAIPRALQAGLRAHLDAGDAPAAARAVLADAGVEIEYCDLAAFDGRPTLVIAARAGEVRLIDNVPLDAPELAGFSRPEDHTARSG